MNLILCGMMGAGKSSVGKKIAELSGRRWADTDDIITNRHGRIPDIFEFHGEAYFRTLESEAVKELSKEDGLVISTGGGLVLEKENCRLLKEHGKIIFLRASLETLIKRIGTGDERPLLKGSGGSAERLSELLSARTPSYEKIADDIIDTDGKTVEDVAAEVIALVEGGL